jgi:heavy metal translocating P-type ATPase
VSVASDIVEPGLQADQRLLDRAWLRIGAGLAVAGQAMVFSLAVNLSPPEGVTYWILHGGLILSAVAVLFFLGGDLVRSALDALRQRRISIDLLFLLTLSGAFAGSLVATFTRTGSVYYEVVAILIVVHTAGKMLGARSRVAVLRAVEQTRERFDSCWVRAADGSRVRQTVRALAANDCVIVAPGEPISVDGEITAGRGYVQETSMTGEWRPVSRGPGDLVLAGTFSIDGSFEIRPAVGPRRLDGILEVVATARLAPSRLQQQADRLVAWFFPVVAVVSAATFIAWMFYAPWNRALFNAMAVLLVACPCAAGLATPVAVWGGLARLASFGLVARTGDFLDALARCDVVCLDKTGTLSTAALAVRAWRLEPAFRARESWLQAAVAATEDGLRHPVAAALQSRCHLIDDKGPVVRERRIEAGLGVVAVVEDESGKLVEIRVGEWLLGGAATSVPNGSQRPRSSERIPGEVGGERATGTATAAKEVFVFVEGAHAATVELQETWREGLDGALEELVALGLETVVLTGDTAAPVGRLAGVTVRAGLTPLEKRDYVRKLTAAGRWVTFVGDGVNDAAAMSAAPASVAMQAGAELAHAAAMAVFAGEDLRFLPSAIRVARGARQSIQTNLGFAAAYNAIGMGLAASGVLHPVAAALLMVGSSAFVSVNALRSRSAVSTPMEEPAGRQCRD